MRKIYNLKFLLCLALICFGALNLSAQVKRNFGVRYQNNIKGDMTFIANNIVNRNTAEYGLNDENYCDEALADSELPNTEYNTVGDTSLYNDCLYMQYIDIDNDASTFSSSSAYLTIPDKSCSRIRYAGLYWAANYQYNIGDDANSGRETDFNQVKFKVPGGSYVNITADDVIFDGFGDADFGETSPYACYADVTNLITALGDPEGDYYVGNIRATEGFVKSGVSGGWTLVLVYENPSLPGKYITSFDGFAGIASGNTTDINYSGFTTLPAPFPVNAKFTISTLEGDNRITGDKLSIKADSNPTFTSLGTATATEPNFNNNFFDSNITVNHVIQNNRNPNSVNTLGYDTDMFDVPNAFNSVIPNSETGATLRASSNGDQYFIYFNALDVEIIEPTIILYKNVEDLAGNDIAGGDVSLGQQIDYVLGFENIGNDDATEYTIKDVFPINTIFIEDQLQVPAGVTYVYDPNEHSIVFTIPDALIEAGDPISEIRIRMQIVESCSELRDACSNLIQNQAFSTYRGVLNDNQITDDPSFSDFDVCGYGTPGSTNFLVGLDECDFVQTVALCGDSVDITAGNGYDTYEWRDSNGNVVGNTQTITVTQTGTYVVTKSGAAPCQSFDETIIVSNFTDSTTHPIVDYADEVVECPNDGDILPKIFLCGVNDNRFIETDITNAQSIEWQKLDESSCEAIGIDDCANKDSGCTWNTLSTDDNFDATQAGQYRVVVFYQNGCFSRFYFNVYENLLDPKVETQDIACNSTGEILVTNVPSGYEFQLVDQTTGTVVVDYQSSPLFTISNPGTYTVNIQQVGVGEGACQFLVADIGIRQRDFDINVTATDTSCEGLGTIRVQALDVDPQYYYEISKEGTSVDTYGPTDDNDYTFEGLNAGVYDVTVTTDDGCSATAQIEIINQSDLALSAQVSQNITCKEGNMLVHPSGGKPPYQFAIYTYNGQPYHNGITDITQIPANAFQSRNIFDVWDPGDYVFVVVDRYNCYAISNEVTIILEPVVEYNVVIEDETCFGANDGSVTIDITDGKGYKTDFSIDGGDNYRDANTFTDLAPGDYTVLIRAIKGNFICEYPEAFTIQPATELFGDIELAQPYSCNQDGIIQIVPGSVTGGTPPYEYSINGNNYSTNEQFTGLTDGTYNVTIRDANGCTLTRELTIDPIDEPTDLAFANTSISCDSPASDVTVTVTGGLAPLTYEIIAPAGSTTNNGSNNVFTGLAPGSYTFLVTDATGCSIQENFNINDIPNIQVLPQVQSNITCFGDTDGAVEISVSGFVSSYTYSITDSSNTTISSGSGESNPTFTVSDLGAGSYTINVTDEGTNCTDTQSFGIEGPVEAIDFTFTASGIDCNGTAANIVVEATGGWGSYTYQLEDASTSTIISAYQNSNIFTGLVAGDYNIYVRDANGCVVQKPHTVEAYTIPSVSLIADSICFIGGDISLTATVTGGTAPYQYSLNGSASQSSNVFTVNSPGTYSVTITDASGCTATSNDVTIGNQLFATATLTKELDCSATPDAIIEVAVTGGTPGYTLEVSINGGAFVATSTPYSASSAGDYQFRATDSAGCQALTNVISVQPITTPVASFSSTDVSCNGDATGVVTIDVDQTQGTPPYQISFNGGTFTAQNTYGGLTAGTYDYTIRDSKGCEFNSTATVNEPEGLDADIVANPTSCGPTGTINGSIDVTLTGIGTAPYTYQLFDSEGNLLDDAISINSTSHNFPDLGFGFYYVTIIDANNCEFQSARADVKSPPYLTLTGLVTATDCVVGASMEVTVSGGTAPYTFSIYGPGTPPSSINGTGDVATFDALTPGLAYTFEVIDSTGCSVFLETDVLDSPSTIELTIDATSNIDCYGAADGSIDFTVSNFDSSVTQIDYDILNVLTNNPVPGFSGNITGNAGGPISATIGLLPPGDYILFVQEANGTMCSSTEPFTIAQPAQAINLQEVSNINANCNIGSQVVVNASSGTPPYQYAFVQDGVTPTNADFTSNNFAELYPYINPNWDVYVRDATGCETSIDITIAADPNPSLTLPSLAQDQCTSDGTSYTFTATPGASLIAPLSYSIGTGFQSSPTFTVSAPGIYTVTIRDGNGCTASEDIEIYPPLSVQAMATSQPSCSNDDGIISVSGNGGSGSYTYRLLDSSLNTTGYTLIGSEFTSVAAGDYAVEITDSNTNCTSQISVSLEPATPVVFSLETFAVSCSGDSDGVIQVILDSSNDNPPYSYTLDDGTNAPITQTTPIFENLVAATYTVTVTSGRNCINSTTIDITEPVTLSATATATPFECNVDNTVNASVITVVATDGTPNYLYSKDGINFFVSNQFTVVDTGVDQTITITVRDANNCETTTDVTIPTLVPIQPTVVLDNALSCTNDEEITVSATGGSGEFSFELLPLGTSTAQTGTSATFGLSNPGDYSIRITDTTTGCFVTATHMVNDFEQIDIIATTTQNVDCFGQADGSISVEITNYSGAYTYDLVDNNGTVITSGSGNTSTGLNVTNLPAGLYHVRLTQTEAPYCTEDSNSVTITAPAVELNVGLTQSALVTCNNDGGAITAVGQGGTRPYEFELINTTTSQTVQVFSGQNIFQNLPSGSYTVTIRDANGCLATSNIDLTQPAPISASIEATPTTLLCFGDNNASVSATNVTGGSGSYQFTLFFEDGTQLGPQANNTFENLGAGTYYITISDGLSCEFTTPQVTIIEPTPVSADLVQAQPMTCTNDAALVLSAKGGTPPYQYSTDGVNYTGSFNSSVNISNIGAGTYQYYVMDVNGCKASITNQVTIDPVEDLQLNLDTSNATINCTGDSTALIRAEASGGLGNYMYELLDSATSTTPLQGPQASGTFMDYPAGTYYVRVVSDDCVAVEGPITITDPTPLEIVSQEVTHVTCLSQDDGSITIEATGGTGIIKYAISPNLDQFDTVNTFTDLAPGNYEVIVQDENGCFVDLLIDILEPEPLTANLVSMVSEICAGDGNGMIEVAIEGGTAPYFTSLNTQDDENFVQDQYLFTDLTGGVSHVIFVKDSGGCDTYLIVPMPEASSLEATLEIENICDKNMPTNSVTVILGNPDQTGVVYSLDGNTAQDLNVFTDLLSGDHYIEVTDTNGGCSKVYDFSIEAYDPLSLTLTETDINEFTAVVTGGTGNYTFYLNDVDKGTDNVYSISESGTYTVRVIDDLGCEATANISMEFIDICIANNFTPNGDGINDYWAPCNTEMYPGIYTKIYDRYGRVVAELAQVDSWDGTYNGNPLPTGDYWYVIKLNNSSDNREFVGHFTLYR
ncbi:T9SS type B sorting domain-containing protein [Aegicerativicinus sediminis]|uniref:T9SS type B sorting domain-containing protein n=1 Tax=Aegicerativicinus sediminis TaxID=2893202 RepID=UPI001E6196F2|nr:T9SS type B sorting domain-containing protein [Aegicerativicinus sediminis]